MLIDVVKIFAIHLVYHQITSRRWIAFFSDSTERFHSATMSDKPKMTGGNKGGNDSVGTTYTQGGGGGNKTGGSSTSSGKASGK